MTTLRITGCLLAAVALIGMTQDAHAQREAL